jgi:transposase
MLIQIHEYLLLIREPLLPKSESGQAIAYVLKNRTALTRYCGDGDLSIDNNGTERPLRGFAIGRTNRTFFGSDNGGKTANSAQLCHLLRTGENRSVCLVPRCPHPDR